MEILRTANTYRSACGCYIHFSCSSDSHHGCDPYSCSCYVHHH